MERLHPHEVRDSESAQQIVTTHFSLSDLEMLEHSSNETWSLGQSFVDKVLERLGVSQKPVLQSSSHYLLN